MRENIKNSELHTLSFPDTNVVKFYLNVDEKSFNILCSDGYIKREGGGISVTDVELSIKGFDRWTVREFSKNDDLWNTISNYSSYYNLKDVCEFVTMDDMIVLRGFALKSGKWTEFSFKGGAVVATCVV